MRKYIDRFTTFLRQKKDILLFIPALAVYCLIMHFSGINCPIKYVTGISCAGCGMTRAYLSLFKGDFAGAFYSHPLFFLPPFVFLILIFKERINEKIYKIFIFTVIIVFVIIYVYRMVQCDGDIVVFKPEDGLIGRMLRYGFHLR